MHLLLVSMHTSPNAPLGAGDAGGMNAVLQAQAPELVRLGHTVDFVTRRDNPTAPDVEAVQDGVRLHRLPAGPASPLAKSAIDDHLDEFRNGLRRLVGSWPDAPDLVHSHHWMSGVTALPVAKELGVAHLQSYHSVAALPGAPLRDGEPPESGRRVAGEASVARGSDLVVAVSEAERAVVIERCGADASRVVVNHPGVDLSAFRPLGDGDLAWHPTGDGRPFVLFAARLQPLKAPDLAIRALAGLPAAKRPLLVIAGDGSADFASYWDDLAALIAELGMGDDVVHVGAQPRPEFARAMRSAAALLVPSHSETFGLVALEGAASGIPVIAAASGGLPEALGDAGIVLPSRAAQVWTNALASLLDEPNLGRELGRRARARAERFGWAHQVAELDGIYRSVAGRVVEVTAMAVGASGTMAR